MNDFDGSKKHGKEALHNELALTIDQFNDFIFLFLDGLKSVYITDKKLLGQSREMFLDAFSVLTKSLGLK